MAQVRRPSLLSDGEPLLLARSAIEAATRFTTFAEVSGLPQVSVLSTPLCATPLPLFTDFGTHPDGSPRRRWAGTRPEFMWHPLMWLPQRVAGRYSLSDSATGTQRLEDDDLWAIRVALEVTASGLYEPATGTWFDVLDSVGIDIETPDGLDRVRRWLDGSPDETLDGIDLSGYLDIDPPSWALESALALRPDLERASWALIADDLLDLADQILSPTDTGSGTGQGVQAGQRRTAAQSLAGLAESLLSQVPGATGGGDDTARPVPSGVADGYFAELYATLRGDTEAFDDAALTRLVEGARDKLHSIRETYWSHVESLGELSDGHGSGDT